MGNPSVRILVVDDHEPFRRFVVSTLQETPGLQVVGEASDGLDAVQKTKKLQPDLILLDIGLPRLNGIEAAQRIRNFSPKSKILFLSQEASPDIVQEALSLGACGYVVKIDAARELLAGIYAVIRGEQFLSSRSTGQHFSGPSDEGANISDAMPIHRSSATRRHEAAFYSDHGRLLDGFSDFITSALKGGKAVIVVATESDRDSFPLRLQAYGVDISAAIEEGRYLSLDADETLSTIMVNGLPDPVQFLKCVGDLIERAAKAVNGDHGRVAACGVCAPLLCDSGHMEAAIEVEHLWDEVAITHKVDILCGYSLATFQGDVGSYAFEKICAEHSAVFSH